VLLIVQTHSNSSDGAASSSSQTLILPRSTEQRPSTQLFFEPSSIHRHILILPLALHHSSARYYSFSPHGTTAIKAIIPDTSSIHHHIFAVALCCSSYEQILILPSGAASSSQILFFLAARNNGHQGN